MKKLLVSVLALASLVACNKDEVIEVSSSSAIKFDQAFVNNATRATEDPSFTNNGGVNDITAFSVWGFMDEVGGDVFNEEHVTKQNDGSWYYKNTQYWLPKHDYYFAALAPANAENVKVTPATTTEKLKLGLGTVEFTNVDGKTDLIYDAKTVSTHQMEVGDNMDPVKLNFGHLLAKTKFTFTNGFVNPNNTIEVTNIRMVVPGDGTIDLATDDWWKDAENNESTWDLGNTTTVLEYGHMDGGAKVPAGAKAFCDAERLTIPADGDVSYEVTFDVVLYNGSLPALERTLTTTITGAPLRMGWAYNFVAELNETNIAEEALKPIEFEVVEVKEWKEIDYEGGVIDTKVANVGSAAEFAKAIADGSTNFKLTDNFTLPANTSLQFGNAPSVKSANSAVPAGAAEYFLDLNGKTITAADGMDAIVVEGGVKLTISGNGTVKAGNNCAGYAVWVPNGHVVINGGTYEVGNDSGTGKDSYNHCVYVGGNKYVDENTKLPTNVSSAVINAGSFIAAPSDTDMYWTLNMKDEFAKNGSTITVYGGEFKEFNPAEGNTENPELNFVAKDYGVEKTVKEDGTWYTVKQMPTVTVNVEGDYALISDVMLTATAKITNGVFNGNNYTIYPAETFKSGSEMMKPARTSEIKDVNFDGKNLAGYGIRLTANGNYKISNVHIKGTAYPFNVTISNVTNLTFEIENATLEGWVSFVAPTSPAKFKNVKFTKGDFFTQPKYESKYDTEYNGYFRPYGNVVLENCDFANGYVIDLEKITKGETITFKNCTVAGVALTAENAPATWNKFQEAVKAGLVVFEAADAE